MTPLLNMNICARLAAQAEDVCLYLFPRGKRQGGGWVCRDWSGAHGQSLRAQVVGKTAGHWRDMSLGGSNGTNLLEVWGRARGITIATATEEAAAWLASAAALEPAPASTTESIALVNAPETSDPKNEMPTLDNDDNEHIPKPVPVASIETNLPAPLVPVTKSATPGHDGTDQQPGPLQSHPRTRRRQPDRVKPAQLSFAW